jgi:hypothetical protein
VGEFEICCTLCNRLVESLHFDGFHKILMHEVQQNARNEMEKWILMYEVQLNVFLGSEELSRQVSWCGAACYAGVVGKLEWRRMLRWGNWRVGAVRNSCTFYTYLKFSGYEMVLAVFSAAIMRSIAVQSQMLRI